MQAVRENRSTNRRRRTYVKRLLYLAVAALVAMLILVPTAMAQDVTMFLPAAALLVGSGVLAFAVLRRR